MSDEQVYDGKNTTYKLAQEVIALRAELSTLKEKLATPAPGDTVWITRKKPTDREGAKYEVVERRIVSIHQTLNTPTMYCFALGKCFAKDAHKTNESARRSVDKLNEMEVTL